MNVKLAIGTDKELMQKPQSEIVKGNGRPQKDRTVLMNLLRHDPPYPTSYIKSVAHCSTRTIARVRKELIDQGELKEIIREEQLSKVGLDFDEEIKNVMGESFYSWLQGRSRTSCKVIFNFCKNIWETVWEKPSIQLLKDSNDPLGRQVCSKFIEKFGEDEKRIRRRKKLIRFFFRFIGRQDLNDRYFTMTKSKDPIAKRELPIITDMSFPNKIDQLIEAVEKSLGKEHALAIRFKLVTMMRTGNRKAEREFLGLKRDTGKSWISFENEDRFKGKILGKGREEWGLDWIPVIVRHDLFKLYSTRKEGEFLFDIDEKVLIHKIKEICPLLELPPLNLHDLRKITITWFWAWGIDLSIATELNVGWKDLNTAKDHYLTINELIRKTDRLLYRKAIPEWFREGLDEYLPIFFTNPQGAS